MCEDPPDVVVGGADADVVVAEDVEEKIDVTAVLPTENVVERLAGAGSSKMRFVGSPQLTVELSDSVPQQAQCCDTLL